MMLTGTLSGCSLGSTAPPTLYGPPQSPAVIESPSTDFPTDSPSDAVEPYDQEAVALYGPSPSEEVTGNSPADPSSDVSEDKTAESQQDKSQ